MSVEVAPYTPRSVLTTLPCSLPVANIAADVKIDEIAEPLFTQSTDSPHQTLLKTQYGETYSLLQAQPGQFTPLNLSPTPGLRRALIVRLKDSCSYLGLNE